MQQTIDDTDRVIAAMLVENTGTHFLDSGMAYGRAWQQNQKAVGDTDPAEFYMAEPEAWVAYDEYGVVSVFHFLRSRLDYAPELDRRFRLWVRMDRTERWQDSHRYDNSYGTVEEFYEAWKKRGWIDQTEFSGSGGLTYNHENVVSQDFHWFFFSTTEESPVGADEFVFVNIHGGCDARGGYTDFRAFRCYGYDGAVDLLGFGDIEYSVECPTCGGSWYIDERNAERTLYSTDGYDLADSWTMSRGRRWDSEAREYVYDGPVSPLWSLFDIEHAECPVCGAHPTYSAHMKPVG